MSIYQGDTKISGNAMMVALPMFFATYQPRKLNNPSWLRADPYSWHSADLYVSAYAHLADNISGITAQTETIAGTTITFYRLSDEIKVVLPDQETNLDAIYNATGIGYYFVLDTTNRQFKLPRNTYGFTGYRGDAGGYVAESLPNITGSFGATQVGYATGTTTGAFSAVTTGTQGLDGGGLGTNHRTFSFNATSSNSAYQNNAPVQQRATQAYLYFYVGNTVQNETSVDVAEMTEAINDKVDLSGSWNAPTNQYDGLTLGASGDSYYAPADGWFMLSKYSAGNGQWANLINATAASMRVSTSGNSGAPLYLTIPAKKGDRIVSFYDATGTTEFFRFIYAQKTN